MTKQELMENYTMEQLAEMVVKYCEKGKIENAEMQVNCPVCGTQFDFNDGKERLFMTVLTDTIHSLEDESEKLKSQLHRKETTINQIDKILNRLFGVTHDIVETPDELEKILMEKADGYKTISDFLPTEPIKVADILINEYHTTDYMGFDISELRQIAEHLLVYCNANGEGEE